MKKHFLLLTFSVFSILCFAQTDSLRFYIDKYAQEAKGKVGIAIMDIETGDTVTYNGKLHAPMQSVFKFPIAMAVLHKVDSGKFRLDQKLHFTKEEMNPKTYSPLRDKHPEGNFDTTISALLSYMVSQSDNVACDKLIELLGGPKQVENYMRFIGANDIDIVATEDQMHSAWKVQYTNWCTPQQMMVLLNNFFNGKYLSISSSSFLYKIMTEANTSIQRIKGLLPQGTVVARKSGSSEINKKLGITAATNDIGIITLPNRRHIILVAFVSDSKADDKTRDLVIAKIAKLVYDYGCAGKAMK